MPRHSADTNIAMRTLSSGPGPIPADHHDPNRPHLPGSPEHRSENRHPLLGLKRIMITGGTIIMVLLITAAVMGSISLRRMNASNDAQAPEETFTANSSISAPLEVHTIFEKVTINIHATTREPLLNLTPAASTAILLPSRATPDAPRPPATARSAPAVTTPDVPMALKKLSGHARSGNCLFSGNWALKKQCEEHCLPWAGRERHCEVSMRSRWICVTCRVGI